MKNKKAPREVQTQRTVVRDLQIMGCCRSYSLFYSLLVDALSEHCLVNLLETSKVCTFDEVVVEAVRVESVADLVVDAFHDLFEFCIDFFCRPGKTFAVLRHFKTAGRYAACVDRFGRSDENAVILQVCDCLVGGGHVGNFVEHGNSEFDHSLCVFEEDFVLSCAGHIDVCFDVAPRLLACDEFTTVFVCVIFDFVAVRRTHFEHIINLFTAYAVRIVDISVGTGECNDLAAELGDFCGRAPSDVAETAEAEGLALELFAFVFEHFVKEVRCAVSCCFGANEGAAVAQTFAGENAVFVRTDDFLVLTEEITDFSSTNAHVACWNVHVGADVAIKLVHKRLAETHNFSVALAGGIKVCAALCTAHRKGSEGVFESLLKAEELHCVEVDVFLEAQTAFVRSDCVVELNAETAIDVIYAVVVHPRHAEHNLSVGLYKTLENNVFSHSFFVLFDSGCERRKNLFNRLHKLGLSRVFQFGLFNDFTDI